MTNKELDKWIAEKVMGFPIENGIVLHGCGWQPTTSIVDAFQLAEKVFPYGVAIHRPQQGDIWRCIVGIEPLKGDMERQTSITVEAETVPLAICLAVKRFYDENPPK